MSSESSESSDGVTGAADVTGGTEVTGATEVTGGTEVTDVTAHRVPLRSLLFVPGSRTGWLPKAEAAGADAAILDLEDAVPEDGKAAACEAVAAAVDRAAGTPPARCGCSYGSTRWTARRAGRAPTSCGRSPDPGSTASCCPR
ncbi:aldolase/citrate lyase family protein [Streptomyces malaysiensis subsp. malaysiensis]